MKKCPFWSEAWQACEVRHTGECERPWFGRLDTDCPFFKRAFQAKQMQEASYERELEEWSKWS